MKKRQGFFYGWVIVGVCFVVTAITYGAVYSFGVFLIPLRETFDCTTAVISGAYSLCLLGYTGFTIFAGWSVDKYGPKITTMLGGLLFGLGLLLTSRANSIWQVYTGYGLIGIGMSSAYAPLMTTVSRWFARRRGLALGIISTGIGAGPLIIAPLASYMTSSCGWRFCFLVLGSAAGLIIALSFLLKRSPEEIGQFPDTKMHTNIPQSKFSQLSLKEAINTRVFWLLACIVLIIGMGQQMIMAHVVVYSEGEGISPMTAATVLSSISGASIVGRIIMGAASDRIGRKKTLSICLVVEGIMIFWLIGASSSWMLFLFAAIFGFCYGGHVPQIPALVGEIFGLEYMGLILGVSSFFWGVGGTLGPVLAGHIYDLTHSYTGAFMIGAVGMLLAAAITATLIFRE